jgi:hypothetical protein
MDDAVPKLLKLRHLQGWEHHSGQPLRKRRLKRRELRELARHREGQETPSEALLTRLMLLAMDPVPLPPFGDPLPASGRGA